MVNICGKCQHYKKTETTNNGEHYHYCDKVNELFPPEPQPDSNEVTIDVEIPTLKVKFNDQACEHYEKRKK